MTFQMLPEFPFQEKDFVSETDQQQKPASPLFLYVFHKLAAIHRWKHKYKHKYKYTDGNRNTYKNTNTDMEHRHKNTSTIAEGCIEFNCLHVKAREKD